MGETGSCSDGRSHAQQTFNHLDCEEIQPAHPKGNQSWVFIGRTDAEAETPILWPPYGSVLLPYWEKIYSLN